MKSFLKFSWPILLGALAIAVVQMYEGWAQGVGPPNPIQCGQFTQGTAATQIATAVQNKSIVICGWDVNANVAAGAFTLASGTGATCGTSTAPVVVYTALPVGVTVDHTQYAYAQAAAGTNLCVTTATTVSWTVYWGQF